jgi:nanoRNase/pAp phosphatase (c-di-AMP/oligoRNAs hydrolase)
MRLLTRSDFDGLACAVLLNKVGIIDSYKFVHPKDLQDGLVEVNENDCLANVPFVKGCGLWFDHHLSETERNAYEGQYHGRSEQKPSCARVIYEYYGGKDTFPGLEYFIESVDKVDSANLTIDDIKNPRDYVLLGFIMDPRTGLGRFRDFRISNYQLMENMIEWCATKSIDEILHLPDVVERIDLYNEQTEKFVEMVKAHTKVMGKTIVTDLRGEQTIYTGNRFMIYSLYPNCNLSVWIVSGKGGEGCSCAVGYSVLNRTCEVNVGSLMLKYGGGGHKAVGTCQFNNDNMDQKVKELLDEINTLNK